MRIGFCSIYSWRPHVEHMEFLAALTRQAGHETFYLTCDSDFPTCYTRELRPDRSPIVHCALCRIGGIRSYATRNVSSIGSFMRGGHERNGEAQAWSLSSASTLGRFESDEDFAGERFRVSAERLEPSAEIGYVAALRWIERERLDAVYVFNGRMDATRGILQAAAKSGIRCVSVERTWFGDGLHLIPDENCLGLHEVSRLVGEWRDKPLRRTQAMNAASHAALRFLRRNNTEWRAYNVNATFAPWPVSNSRRRILLTPGSRNEVWGHPDWSSAWRERTAAFDAIIDQLNLGPEDVVLRCHPNWGEKIGNEYGQLSEDYYTQWARKRGIFTIASRDSTSTLGLIEHADAVIVCGGSAALEAAIIGKQVIAITPSSYQAAGFESTVCSPDQVAQLHLLADADDETRKHEAARISRLSLRFCYTMAYRVAQFVDFVQCLSPTQYRYFEGADPEILSRIVRRGRLDADDPDFAADDSAESEVIELIKLRAWDKLANKAGAAVPRRASHPARRRWLFRSLDRIRATLPRGDV
jgi:hypothetical protein